MGNNIDRIANHRLEFRTILVRLKMDGKIWSRSLKVVGKERRGKDMKHKFSVFRNAVKRYDRKKMAFVVFAIGVATMGLLIFINEIYTLGEVSMQTEVVVQCAETSRQKNAGSLAKKMARTANEKSDNQVQPEEIKLKFPLEIGYGKDRLTFWLNNEKRDETSETETVIPTNSELAGDTLLGVASISGNSSEKETLFSSSHLLKKPAHMLEQQQKMEVFSFMNTMEEQNVDALQIQEQQVENQSENGEIISLSEQDYSVLLRIVEAEATDEDVKGRMLVANVVLNRVNCTTEFPDNVTDVVFDTTGGVYQFSPIEDGRYWSVEISDKTREAVHRVLCGEDESQGALYFMARQYADADNVVWFDSSLSYLFAYVQHEFFR